MFLDSPVHGLSFTAAPSNVSGVTNASGEFTYEAGDTVTFSVGELVLGSVTGQDTVTPLTVAQALVAANPGGDVETITVNVLAFLQSLDSDGNADNGITIGETVADAMSSNAIDFQADATTFTTSLGNLVSAVESAAGVDLTVVSREQAEEHFVSQVPTLVAGTYVWAGADGVAVTQKTRTLTLFENGKYLYGGYDDDVACNDRGHTDNGNGVEMGTYAFNPLTGSITFAMTFETNGSCGPETDGDEQATLSIEGDTLHIEFEDADTYWVPVPSTAGELAGSWVLPFALMQDWPLVVSIFPSSQTPGTGRYFLVDTLNEYERGDAGIEEGCYTLAADGSLSADLTAACPDAVDTNDDAGLSHPNGVFSAEVDEHGRFRVVDAEATTDFARLPLQAYSHEDRAGAWYLNEVTEGVEPMSGRNLFVVALFDDGRYLLGGIHDDAQCEEPTMTAQIQDPNGNGVELGQLTATALNGVVTPSVSSDTNGGCGLHNGASDASAAQPYLLTRSALDGSLIVYPHDDSASAVFTRLPSQDDGLVGAWIAGADTGVPYMTVFMPTGVVFDVSAGDGDESGLFSWTYEADAAAGELTLTWGGANCVDTQGDYDDCSAEEETEEATYELDGNELTVQYVDGDPMVYTRITP